MSNKQPTKKQWTALYDAADAVKTMAPWGWLDETQLFGFVHPETQEQYFVSVMGQAGEHFAVAVYVGWVGLVGFLEMQMGGPLTRPELLLETPQLQAAWEDRELIEKEDYGVIQSLERKYRGRKSWPQFRSYRAGYAPWFVDSAECETLTIALTQLLDLAPRLQENNILPPLDDDAWLMRKQIDGKWQDQFDFIEEPPPRSLEIAINAEALEQLKALPQSANEFEVDLFMALGMQVGTPDTRGVIPYMLLIVDGDSGMVFGVELLQVETDITSMLVQVPNGVVEILAKACGVPAKIVAQDERLLGFIDPIAQILNIELEYSPVLPMLTEAKQALMERFG